MRNGTAIVVTLLSCPLFSPLRCAAQNLIPNPGFELIDSCPQYPALLGFQPGARPQDWYSFSDTPDYFTACSNDTLNGVPSNVFGTQPAYDGQAYAGFACYQPDGYRELIGAQLTQPLSVGEIYYASCYVSPTVGGNQLANLAINRVGMLLSTFPIYSGQGLPGYPLVNQALIQAATIVSDTANWTLISGSFVANQAYSYVVLGNLFDNEHTDTVSISTGFFPLAYYYVDHVCLSSSPNGCDLSTAMGSSGIVTPSLFPHPAVDHVCVAWPVAGNWMIKIIEPSGRCMLQKDCVNVSRMEVYVDDWAPGSYVVQLSDGHSTITRRLVVVR